MTPSERRNLEWAYHDISVNMKRDFASMMKAVDERLDRLERILEGKNGKGIASTGKGAERTEST